MQRPEEDVGGPTLSLPPYFFETGFLTKPGAVLADIKLADGSWGLEFGPFSCTESIHTRWKIFLLMGLATFCSNCFKLFKKFG